LGAGRSAFSRYAAQAAAKQQQQQHEQEEAENHLKPTQAKSCISMSFLVILRYVEKPTASKSQEAKKPTANRSQQKTKANRSRKKNTSSI